MHTLLRDQILEKLQGFDCRGGVKVERLPRMREIGLRSPVATDLSRKNR